MNLDSLKEKAQDVLNNENVKNVVDKAKDLVEDGKEYLNTDKGKEAIKNVRDKVEDFVADKTNGKGIGGFGKA